MSARLGNTLSCRWNTTRALAQIFVTFAQAQRHVSDILISINLSLDLSLTKIFTNRLINLP